MSPVYPFWTYRVPLEYAYHRLVDTDLAGYQSLGGVWCICINLISLKIKAGGSFEMMVTGCRFTLHRNPTQKNTIWTLKPWKPQIWSRFISNSAFILNPVKESGHSGDVC
jgi:hypothetical protein